MLLRFLQGCKTESWVGSVSDEACQGALYTRTCLQRLYSSDPSTAFPVYEPKAFEKVSIDFKRCLPLGEGSMFQKTCRLDLPKVQASSQARNYLPTTKNLKTGNFSLN
jgi:hypothetical protein